MSSHRVSTVAGVLGIVVPAALAIEVGLPIVERAMAGWGSEVADYAYSTSDMLRLPARLAGALVLAWAIGALCLWGGRPERRSALSWRKTIVSAARRAPRVAIAAVIAGAAVSLWLIPAHLLLTIRSDPALRATLPPSLGGLSSPTVLAVGACVALGVATFVAARLIFVVPAAVESTGSTVDALGTSWNAAGIPGGWRLALLALAVPIAATWDATSWPALMGRWLLAALAGAGLGRAWRSRPPAADNTTNAPPAAADDVGPLSG